MPDSSDSSGTCSETAQSSLLRLTRRHSLPASTTFSTFLSLWSAENATRQQQQQHTNTTATTTTNATHSPTSPTVDHERPQQQQQQQARNRSSSLSGATLLNGVNGNNGSDGNSGIVGGNRHRYGHRHTRSAAVAANVVDRPVIVKSYNPEAAVSRNASPLHEDEDPEDLALPSIDSFSFDGIIKAIDPAVTTALDAVSKLCAEYQTTLKVEVGALTDTQTSIDATMKEADKLTTQALKTTKTRTERLDAEAVGLKGGATVDALAEAAEATHTTLTSIITTLLAIDEMLPPQDRLSPLSSAHKGHYPQLHTLLADKAHQIELRFRNIRSPELRPQNSRISIQPLNLSSDLNDDPGESSTSTWPHNSRRRLSSATLLDSPQPPISHHRGASSPHLMLRTVLPSPFSPDPPVSASGSGSGSYFPIASKAPTGVSLASPSYKAGDQGRVWARRASTSTLAAFVAAEEQSVVVSSTWRHSAGSWAGFFGGRRASGGAEGRVSAEERLKRLLDGAQGKSKGKGKGKGVVGR